jgi:integrase
MGQGARPPVSRKLPFLKSYRDRHGKVRHYFRKAGCRPFPLPGEYGDKAFMAAYWEARENPSPRELGADRTAPGSISALIVLYYKSKAYAGLAAITQRTYRNVLERFRASHGHLQVRGIRQRHVADILEKLPANADTWRKVIRLTLILALERGWIDVHPMAGMRRPRKAKTGFRPWTEEDIALYEAKWPTGTRERLALALLLYTAQRRDDVRVMGRQHVQSARIRVRQHKTGTELWIPIHPALQAELDYAPKDQLTFLQTQYGQPFSAAGFTSWFVEKAQAAGCPKGCTPHGLRKASLRRLAEAGCTSSEIMSISGHKNLSEVTLYTASADQERLATRAIARTNPSNPEGPVRQSGRNV